MQSMIQASIEDQLVCGSCQRNFPLGNIVTFMQHKKYDCAEQDFMGLSETLACQSCPRQFGTPWSLLKHAQNVHALKIYLERSHSTRGIDDGMMAINAISSCQEKLPLFNITKNRVDSAVELKSGERVEQNITNETTAVQKSELLKVDVSPECTQLGKREESDLKQKLPSRSGESGESISESAADDVARPVLEKCCTSVIPKKRKRHMETKHGSAGRKRIVAVPSAPTSIYIDLEPGHEGQGFRASVSHSDDRESERSAKQPFKSSEWSMPTGMYRHSVIIQPGTTFSIPVSYNTTSTQSPSSYTSALIGSDDDKSKDSILLISTKQGSVSQASCSDRSGHPEHGSGTFSTQSQQYSTGMTEGQHEQGFSSYDASADELHGPETEQGKTHEQRRRRYPTSRPFKCDQCNDAFNQRIHLKKHLSKHTGVKPFKCTQCDYSTVERSHLKVHIRVHTGEKPYKCTYCEYATAQNSTLKIHLKRHHYGTISNSDKPTVYTCTTCGQHFEEHDTFTTHTVKVHPKTVESSQTGEHHPVSAGAAPASYDVTGQESIPVDANAFGHEPSDVMLIAGVLQELGRR